MAGTVKAGTTAPVADRFVGRERELGELCAGLNAAAAGHGRFFLVSGEPGIGKTRLVDELDAIARRQGARVWWARCWEDGGSPAYWPWAQLIRSYIAEGAPEASLLRLAAADEVAALVPELSRAAPTDGTPRSDPERAGFRVLDTVAGVFKSAAAERPLVLVIDDVHAADAPTLRLLSFLARDLRAARLLLIACFRETEIRQRSEVADVVAELERVGQRLPLRGWAAADIARFIADGAARSPSESLLQSVHRATGGNPLFVGEIARLLTAERGLGRSDTTVAGLRLPERVREAVRQHLRSLSHQVVEVLSIAAVLGDECDLDLLARVAAGLGASGAHRSRAQVLDWFREANTAGLVWEVKPGTYRFTHGLLGGMLYDDLMPARRIEWHRTAAAVLAAHDRGNVAAVAHHLYHAAVGGDVTLAVDYQCRAGAQAMRELAYERAAEFYARGLHLLDAHALADAARQGELLLALGSAQARGGAPALARVAFERAALLARQCNDANNLAGAALGSSDLGLVAAGPDPHDACVPLLREALTALDEADSSLRARVLARFSVARAEPHMDHARAALAMARRLDDPHALAQVLIDVHSALWEPEHAAERRALAAEALHCAEQCHDLELIAGALTCEIPDLIELGDAQRLDHAIAELVRRADALGQPRTHWWATHFRSVRALLRGDLAVAETLAHDAQSIGERIQDPSATSVLAAVLCALRTAQGRAEELEPAVHVQVQQCSVRTRRRCGLTLAISALDLPAPRSLDSDKAGEAPGQSPQVGQGDARVFRREGEFWTLSYADVTCRFKDSKGFAFIAHLLRHPGQDVHATALVASAGGDVDPGEIGREVAQGSYLQVVGVRVGLGDAGELIDARAKAEYKQRLVELREDLEDAEANGHSDRAERVRDEIETLNRELCRAIGIGGRDRRAGSHAERARVNVTRAIGGVIKRIGERNPALAEHLAASIKTGTFCAYRPDRRESSWSMAG